VNRQILWFSFGWILSAFFAGDSPAQTTAPTLRPRSSISAAYWNIQWFPGRRPNATRGEELKQINSVHRDLSKIDADFVGMEEVRDFQHAAIAIEMLRGFKVDVCSNFPPREGENVAQQVAIASRLQPLSAWAEQWKAGSIVTPPRGFAFAAYEIAPRQLLLAYALHLKSNRGALREDIAMREESICQLLQHMSAMTKAYGKLGALTWIIGGDFNTAPDDPKFAGEKTTRGLLGASFNWVWQNVPRTARITFPPDRLYPAACFDHIFYKGAALRRAGVVSTSAQSSDHRAIQAIFDLSAN